MSRRPVNFGSGAPPDVECLVVQKVKADVLQNVK
jgi:hypothetical protein